MLTINAIKYSTKQQSFGNRITDKALKPDYIPDAVWKSEQEILKNPEKNGAFNKLAETISKQYVKGNYQLMPIEDYITNSIFCKRNFSTEQKITMTNDAFRLYEKLLAYNPPETVRKNNPIDITTIIKVLLSELDCKDIKFEGIENLENGYSGYNILSTYHSLAEMIKFAQTQCKNKDITLKFEKPAALYTTLSYKGSAIDSKDIEKILPKTYYYSLADCEKNNIIINNYGDSSQIKVKMYTLDELYSSWK